MPFHQRSQKFCHGTSLNWHQMMCFSTRWMLNWLEGDQVLYHLYFHTSKVGILQAINHVLVYCFGVNAFYTPFVADFNLITNHPYVYLSLLQRTQKWKDEKGKKRVFCICDIGYFWNKRHKPNYSSLFFFKLTIRSICKHILLSAVKFLCFMWKHCQFSETKSFFSEGPVSWGGVYPGQGTMVSCHWKCQVKNRGYNKMDLKKMNFTLFFFSTY